MHDVYETAKRRCEELRSELTKLESFIEVFESMTATKPAKQPSQPAAAPYADEIEAIIRAAGRPMTRGEITAGLAMRGITIKPNYLGTLLWRMRDRFENVKGKGYRPK